MAEVVSIHRAGERDAPAQSLTSATVRTDFGLEGDFRSQRAGRHVTLIEEETLNAQVAAIIYQVRTKAGLTQQELADLVGTKQPVIARLEDANYEGHSLTMLQRIAQALNKRVEVRLLPAKRPRTRRAA